jgi:hypothetical protein
MDQHTPPAALVPSPEAQELDTALTELSLLVEEHGHVVVLHPAALPAAHVRRLHMLRAMLETDRVALLPVDLPPLGVAVLARQLRQLSVCGFGAGIVASAARLLSHYVYAGALLNSVTRLDHIPVGLKSHAKSWLPGAQFGVLANPAPELVRAGNGLLKGPDFATRMAVAGGQLPPDWVVGTLAPHWQTLGLEEVPLPAASPAWWGTGKLVEFAAFLPDIHLIHQLVSSVRRETCTWCGIELIGDRCGFCAAVILPGIAHPELTGAAGETAPGTPAAVPAGPPDLEPARVRTALPGGPRAAQLPSGRDESARWRPAPADPAAGRPGHTPADGGPAGAGHPPAESGPAHAGFADTGFADAGFAGTGLADAGFAGTGTADVRHGGAGAAEAGRPDPYAGPVAPGHPVAGPGLPVAGPGAPGPEEIAPAGPGLPGYAGAAPDAVYPDAVHPDAGRPAPAFAGPGNPENPGNQYPAHTDPAYGDPGHAGPGHVNPAYQAYPDPGTGHGSGPEAGGPGAPGPSAPAPGAYELPGPPRPAGPAVYSVSGPYPGPGPLGAGGGPYRDPGRAPGAEHTRPQQPPPGPGEPAPYGPDGRPDEGPGVLDHGTAARHRG